MFKRLCWAIEKRSIFLLTGRSDNGHNDDNVFNDCHGENISGEDQNKKDDVCKMMMMMMVILVKMIIIKLMIVM